jgi:hypothetical protein
MKILDILTEAKKPEPPKTRSPAAASLADRKFQQKIVPNKKKKIDPKHKTAIGMDESSKPVDNFSIDDIKKLERVRDFGAMKLMAKELIATPSQKPMKPEKVAWFNRKIDSLKSPMQLIKLMYDLVLSGEGHSVVGSKNSMASNNYRQKFGEELADQMPGEYDMEGDHVKHNLKTIMRSCKRLYNALGDDENLPEWVEDKIAQAQSMLISATEYMLTTHDDSVFEEFSKESKKKIKEARKSPWDKMAGAVKQSSGKDLNKGDERAQYALKGLKQSAKDYLNIVDKDKTLKEAKNPAQQAAIAIAKKKSNKKNEAVQPGQFVEPSDDAKQQIKSINQQSADKAAIGRAKMGIMSVGEGGKQKGVDGKACWTGYKRMGTKKKGGKTVDNCVPTGK